MAEQSSQSSQQVAGAAHDIGNAVQQVSALSQELAKRAEELTAAVRAFRLA